MRRILTSVVIALFVAVAGLTAAVPVNASPLPDPKASDCGASYTKTRSGSYVTIAMRYRCSYPVYQINHGLTVQRASGKAFISSTKSCSSSSGLYSCTRKWTFKDPAGSQRYFFYDELRVRYNPWDGEGFSVRYEGAFWA